MQDIRFYISNNVNANIPIQLFADPDPNSNIGAVTKYQWDLTGLSFANNNVTFVSLQYRPIAGSVFTTFTYSGIISGFTQLLNILNGIGIGIFYQEEANGYTYLAISTENYFLGDLTLLPALSYEFLLTADAGISLNVGFTVNFSSPTDVTINWADGSTNTYTNQNGSNTYNHTLTVITGVQFYEIQVAISTSATVTNINASGGGNNFIELASISALNSLTTLNVANNAFTALPPVPSTITNLDCSNNNITSSQVNSILVLLDGYGLLSGTFDSSGQTPAAPPTGTGITAKNNLISKGWTVATD